MISHAQYKTSLKVFEAGTVPSLTVSYLLDGSCNCLRVREDVFY